MCWSDHRYRDEDRREYRRPDSTPADQRVSDADRQRTIDTLRAHTADGRLTLDEFEARVGEAWRATTHGELRTVLRELPVMAAPRQERTRRGGFGVPVPLLILALVVAGSVVFDHFAWWLIPVGFWVFGGCGVRHARRYDDERATRRDDTLISA
jgi:hypothetical protein